MAEETKLVVNVNDPEAGDAPRRNSARGHRTASDIGNAPLNKDEAKRDISRDLFCFVLGTGKYGSHKSEQAAEEYRQTLVNDMVAAGLDVTLFYSTQEDEVYIKVGTDDHRLLQEADHIEYSLELDEVAMKTIAESEKCLPDRAPLYLEAPFHDEHGMFKAKTLLGEWSKMDDASVASYMAGMTSLPPYRHLHARYNNEWERYGKQKFGTQIYKLYGRPDSPKTILRTADRMKLIQIIMERNRNPDMATGARGAGLNLSAMVLKKKILAVFPMQNTETAHELGEPTVDELFNNWNRLCKLPWEQPLDDIRDYFGEKIALYFAFLGHYTMWLSVAAVIGIAMFFHQLASIKDGTGNANFFDVTRLVYVDANETLQEVVVFSEVPEAAIFSIFIAFWATFMLEFWKRKQSWLALRWGTSTFERQEVIRPEFVPSHYLPNPVTGQPEPYYSARVFLIKLASSVAVIVFCIGVVISAIAGIFVFKVFVSLDPEVTGLDQETGTYVALVINAVVIMILGTVYKTVAKLLNDWENHRTDTQYEDALIAKTFIFCFVNSFATLFYMAFIKSGSVILGQTQLCEPKSQNGTSIIARDACFGNLGSSLLIVFLLQMILNNALEVGIPTLMGFINKVKNTRVPKNLKVTDEKSEMKIRSPCEDQFFKKSYEGTFDDFLEIALQFGYVTLFVAAFPLAPFLAFINNQLEIRVDSFKLCKLCRRPVNFGAQDIGTWQSIFYFMGLMAVMTNAGVIFFTSRIIVIQPTAGVSPDALRVWAWVISVGSVMICKWLADVLLSDVPNSVKVQLQREDFIVRKCLLRERDDDTPDPVGHDVSKSKEHTFEIFKVDPMIKAVVADLAKRITAEMGSLEEGFKKADTNKDGNVSVKEFRKLVKGFGGIQGKLTEQEVDAIIDCLDYNNNGKIEYEEFIKLAN